MTVQYVSIKDSKVTFVNEDDNPEHRLTKSEQVNGDLLFASMMDKMKISQLESGLGGAVMEIMMLKMGGNV